MGALDPYVHCACKAGMGRPAMGDIDDWVRWANQSPYLTDVARAAATQAARAASSASGGSVPTLVTSYPADAAQVRALQSQLNRYVSAPSIGVLSRALPVNGSLDIPTAMAAALVLLKRARDSAATYGETGAMRDVLKRAGLGIVNPVPYIGADLTTAIQIIALYADLKGLPPAKPESVFERVLDHRVLAVAAVVGAVFFIRKGGRRR